MSPPKNAGRPLAWVPTAYLAEGIPFAMAIWVTGTMFKNLGHSDTEIAVVTGSIGIAWSLKPLWAAFLDMFATKKFFVLAMELAIAGLLAATAFALKLPNYFTVIAGILWLIAFASATQDICVDGIYITALDKKRQAAWMGTQSGCWNLGRMFGTSLIVGLASVFIGHGSDSRTGWTYALLIAAGTMAAIAVYHYFVLPTGSLAQKPHSAREVAVTFGEAVKAFFQKKSIWGMLIFVFLYRSGEGLLLVEAPLFMQAAVAQGGLGLSLAQKSLVDGSVGTIVSVAGGLAGGLFVARYGLRRSLLILAVCMNVPHLCYIALSHLVSPGHPVSLLTIYALVSVEKFGYNFGFVGNMLYMMQQIAPGRFKMTHYAFATSLMNLVLVPTQSVSGYLADKLGYRSFFIFVLVASIPSIIAAWKAPFPNPPDLDEEDENLPAAAAVAATAAPSTTAPAA
ncbi:MAG TPA: MFS transporter [Polyangia bacterium]|nr:MFS transporter [Polyangia bacterium]